MIARLVVILLFSATAFGGECRFADLLRKGALEKGLPTEALHEIAESESPRNPIAPDDQSLGAVPSFVYRRAFDALLGERAHDWPTVRAEARRLLEARGVAAGKTEVARVATEKVFEPFVRVAKASHDAVGQTDSSNRPHEVYVAADGTTFVRYASFDRASSNIFHYAASFAKDGSSHFAKLPPAHHAILFPGRDGHVSVAALEAADGRTIRLYDARTGALENTLTYAANSSGMRHELLAFESPSGPMLVVASQSSVALIDPATGQQQSLILPGGNYTTTTSADRKKLYVLAERVPTLNIVTEWPGGREVMQRSITTARVPGTKIAVHERTDGEVLMAIRNGAQVDIISTKRPTITHQIVGTVSRSLGGFVDTDGKLMFFPELTASKQPLIDLNTGAAAELIPSPTLYWENGHIARAADGTTLLVAHGQAKDGSGMIELHDLATGKRRTFPTSSPIEAHKVDAAFPSSNGGIGTLIWTGPTLQIGQVYGPLR